MAKQTYVEYPVAADNPHHPGYAITVASLDMSKRIALIDDSATALKHFQNQEFIHYFHCLCASFSQVIHQISAFSTGA
jgi:hypothetical protein